MQPFLMVKPDGICRGLLPMVRAALQSYGVTVREEREVEFRRGDVPLLWPRIQSATHPLTVELLTRYLTSGPSRLLLLDPPQCLAAAQQVKHSLRRRFGDRMFGNLVHVADDPAAAEREWRVLNTPAGARTGDLVSPLPSARAADAAEVTVSEEQAVAECALLWSELTEGRFEIRHTPSVSSPAHEHQLLLHDDDVNTPDTFVEGLLAAVPRLTLADALHLTVQLDFTDAAPVATCTERSYSELAERLRAHGIERLSMQARPATDAPVQHCSFRDIPIPASGPGPISTRACAGEQDVLLTAVGGFDASPGTGAGAHDQ